jgi:hypothetical protein
MDMASIAVWDIPLPVVAGASFQVKVGVKSQAGAAGREVEVRDRDGNVIASGKLGGTPWPETEALYWVELSVPSPAADEVAEFAVRSGGAASRFSVAAMPKPDHTLTVTITDRDSAVPLGDVEIRLGAFHARTGANGRAQVPVCKGTYQLELWRNGYHAPGMQIEIVGNAAVQIAMVHVPEDHPDARWVR